jgi:probable addiction module antidote protein
MTEKLYDYDFAEKLDDIESIEIFLEDAFETNDPSYIAQALGVVARSKGMSEIAQKTGLSREQLYRSLSDKGNPTLQTLLAVLTALNLHLKVTA